jgi:hypothetical protein
VRLVENPKVLGNDLLGEHRCQRYGGATYTGQSLMLKPNDSDAGSFGGRMTKNVGEVAIERDQGSAFRSGETEQSLIVRSG